MPTLLAVVVFAGCDVQEPKILAQKWAQTMGYTAEAVSCYASDCSVRLAGVPQPVALKCQYDHCIQVVSQ